MRAQRPAEIVNATDIGSAPKLLAGALALAALSSLALALATSVRRRRNDLAVLNVLGFTRRQIGATVRWQAGSTVLVGFLIGVPLGVITGRVLWRMFAEQLAVVSQASNPYLTILAVATISVVIALLAGQHMETAPRYLTPSADSHALWHDVVNADGDLVRRSGEAAIDALLHPGHQDSIAELLPALLRLVHRDDRPTTG